MKPAARSITPILGLVLALAATLGLASPAAASYPNTPRALSWIADGPVHAVAVSGDRVYVGGMLSAGIVALDAATGSLLWSVPTDGDVRAIAVSTDGERVFAGGGFLTANGETHKRLVAISASDGHVVSSWKPRATAVVRALALDGDILYVGGKFGAINNVKQKGLGAVLASTGSVVANFKAFTDATVYSLAVSGSTLIASGAFLSANGVARSSIASFNLPNGDVTPWAPERVCPTCNIYWDVAVDAQNAYVGASGPGGQLVAYDLVTGQQPWPYVHTDGDVQTVTVADDGLVYLGGHFAKFVGTETTKRTLVAAVDGASGVVDPLFAPKIYDSYPGIWALATSPSSLYMGGDFTGVGVDGISNRIPYFAAFGM